MTELKKYLTINSLFSGVSGLAMLIFSSRLDAFFHLENQYVLPIIGGNLIVFSLFVWFVRQRHMDNKILIFLISGLDVLWVLGSLIIMFGGFANLSGNGNLVIGVVAVWIGFLAYMQFRYSR